MLSPTCCWLLVVSFSVQTMVSFGGRLWFVSGTTLRKNTDSMGSRAQLILAHLLVAFVGCVQQSRFPASQGEGLLSTEAICLPSPLLAEFNLLLAPCLHWWVASHFPDCLACPGEGFWSTEAGDAACRCRAQLAVGSWSCLSRGRPRFSLKGGSDTCCLYCVHSSLVFVLGL